MILATVADLSSPLDGRLVVVHPNYQRVAIQNVVGSLREALDGWSDVEPHLREIDGEFRNDTYRGETRRSAACTFRAPLPRTWAFFDGSAFVHHVKLARKARGAELPPDLLTVPLLYQGASDNLLGPTDDIPLVSEAHGMDFESEIAVVTDAVPLACRPQDTAPHIKLLLLLNDVSLRELIPREIATGFGFLQGKPPSSFAPFALTPDELGNSWRDGRLHLPVRTELNGKLFGEPNAGAMHFSFLQLIAHATLTRPLSAGTIVGSGTVSNEDPTVGSSCLVERRMIEKLDTGKIATPYLCVGDRVRIEVLKGGRSLFGAIDQQVVRHGRA